jgi:hypothetical protein
VAPISTLGARDVFDEKPVMGSKDLAILRLGLEQRTLRHVSNHAMHHADARLTEAAPCECCRFAHRCAIEHQACAAFSMYLANEPAVRWRLVPRAPTTARYAALLG